jgi:hypothetical protein
LGNEVNPLTIGVNNQIISVLGQKVSVHPLIYKGHFCRI